MAIKAINNLAGPDRIIPTLLVFRLSVTKRAKVIRAATKEVRYL